MTMNDGVATPDMLRRRVRRMVFKGDLNQVTVNSIVRALEEEFRCNIDKKRIKPYIARCVKRREKMEAQAAQERKSSEEKEKEKWTSAPGPDSFHTVFRLSPQLVAVTGQQISRRQEAVKHLWEYIKENKLQDPNDKKLIICAGNKLYDVFKVDKVNCFEMNKNLQQHFLPMEEGYEDIDLPRKKNKDGPQPRRHAFLAPYPISQALQSFLGTEQAKMSRAEVVARIWEYILDNRLQDDSKNHKIICDDKMRELFQRDSMSHSRLSKMIAKHFLAETS